LQFQRTNIRDTIPKSESAIVTIEKHKNKIHNHKRHIEHKRHKNKIKKNTIDKYLWYFKNLIPNKMIKCNVSIKRKTTIENKIHNHNRTQNTKP
jgi:hypothetical protein